ncbi:hypothetical protein D3C85_1427280 [compost metagenome]
MAFRHLGYSLTIRFSATVDAEPAVGGRAKPKPTRGVDCGLSCSDLHMAFMNGTKVVSKLRVGQ